MEFNLVIFCYICAMRFSYTSSPFGSIILVAFVLRLFAAIFSGGYAMHDDHYYTFDMAYKWFQSGFNYTAWFEGIDQEEIKIENVFNLFYPGIHYIVIKSCSLVGIVDPKIMALVIRLLHAFASTSSVFFCIKIASYLYSEKIATKIGWLLACFWLFPFIGVRSLSEVMCSPFLLFSVYLLFKNKLEKNYLYALAGCIGALAISIRFQSASFLIGLVLYLLLTKRFKPLLYYLLGCLISLSLTDGILGYYFWRIPFGQYYWYVQYNLTHSAHYAHSNRITQYIEILIGLGLTMGIFYLIGFFREYKKSLILFLPTLLFILAHSLIENKQERFIFPILPFYLILGIGGWERYLDVCKKEWVHKLNRIAYPIFIFLNLVLLLVFSSYYTKKSRVEAMHYLYQKDADAIVTDYSTIDFDIQLPSAYAGKEIKRITFYHHPSSIDKNANYYLDRKNVLMDLKPSYIYFFNDENLDLRVQKAKTVFKNIKFEQKIEGSFLDWLIHKINPVNDNPEYYIYSTNSTK